MYKKILVPLDGSKLAECALPYAEELARGCQSEEVILVSVTEAVTGYRTFDDPSQPLEQRFVSEAAGKEEAQAQKYLARIAKGLKEQGIKVVTEVLIGHPAEEITIYAKHPGCDIIIMSSHGRTGPSRWTHGSVANKVLMASPVPVMIIRAPGCTIGV
jgi:nucleotide-binding universal stress UspA family protein